MNLPLQARRRSWPAINQDTQFFWDGVSQGELRIQKCSACATLIHPPKPHCSNCGSFDLSFDVMAGSGTIFSHVTFHRPLSPGFDEPYNVSLIDLDEGVRIVSQVVGISPDAVRIGLPVMLKFVEVEAGLTLPMFLPLESEAEVPPHG